MVPLGVVASACLAVLGAAAQDRGGRDTGAKDVPTASTFTGRISDVDIGRRTIELKYTPSGIGGAARGVGGAGSRGAMDTGGVGGEDTGRIGKGGPKDTGGVGGEEDLGRNAGGKATGRTDLGRTGTPAGRAGTVGTMVFRVPETARITLDGKAATLGDLRANTYARIRATRGPSAGTAGRTENSKSGGGATRAKDSRAGGAKGSDNGGSRTVAPLAADRVEAVSQEPDAGRVRSTDTDTRGKDR